MKIIQIQIDSQPACQQWNAFQELFALCDDGSVLLLINPGCVDRSILPVDDLADKLEAI